MSKWQPMETAPKDGTPILLWIVHYNSRFSTDPVKEGWQAACKGYWTDFNDGGWTWWGLSGNPELWCPIENPTSEQIKVWAKQ